MGRITSATISVHSVQDIYVCVGASRYSESFEDIRDADALVEDVTACSVFVIQHPERKRTGLRKIEDRQLQGLTRKTSRADHRSIAPAYLGPFVCGRDTRMVNPAYQMR